MMSYVSNDDATHSLSFQGARQREPGNDGGGRPQLHCMASQLPCITEHERAHAPRRLFHKQGARDRRLGPLSAVLAFAKSAVDAERGTLGLSQIHTGGIGELSGMAYLASHADREARRRIG